jgi:predicted membrane protein
MSVTELFLAALFVILALPWAVWRLIGPVRAVPLVVVQIMAGVLMGPGIMGVVWPEAHAALFAPPVMAALSGVA